MKIGLYPMVADVIHAGHMIALEEAKSKCDYLIVALYCCPSYKKPIQSIYERFTQLRAIKFIDEVVPFQDTEDFRRMLLSIRYDTYFLGADYIGKSWENVDVIKDTNKEIIYLTRQHNMSSSSLKDRICSERGDKE